MKKIVGNIKISHPVSGNKEEILQLLAAKIASSPNLKLGINYYEGFEVLSTKTFFMDIFLKRSTFSAILKVKEKQGKTYIESEIKADWYFELTIFFLCLVILLFMIYDYYFDPINVKNHSPSTLCFFCIAVPIMSIRKLYLYKKEGFRVIEQFLSNL